MISIIVPVLNEGERVTTLSAYLEALSGKKEIIFVDGGSTDDTAQRVKVIKSAPGRARQMNQGAVGAKGDWLWFVHADSHVHNQSLQAIESCSGEWGAFTLAFDRPSLSMKMIAWGSNWRLKWRHVAFGDQGIFVRRKTFESLGGWVEMPLMEDYHWSLEMKVHGLKPEVIPLPIVTSARRFLGHPWSTVAVMQKLQRAYRKGGDACELAKEYESSCRPIQKVGSVH